MNANRLRQRRCRAFRSCGKPLGEGEGPYCNDCVEEVWAWGPCDDQYFHVPDRGLDVRGSVQCDDCGGDEYVFEIDPVAPKGPRWPGYATVRCWDCGRTWPVRRMPSWKVTF